MPRSSSTAGGTLERWGRCVALRRVALCCLAVLQPRLPAACLPACLPACFITVLLPVAALPATAACRPLAPPPAHLPAPPNPASLPTGPALWLPGGAGPGSHVAAGGGGAAAAPRQQRVQLGGGPAAGPPNGGPGELSSDHAALGTAWWSLSPACMHACPPFSPPVPPSAAGAARAASAPGISAQRWGRVGGRGRCQATGLCYASLMGCPEGWRPGKQRC